VSRLRNDSVLIVVMFTFSLLVLVGFAAAFIISLFPKPTSARKIVRLRAAKIVDALADLYMDELRGFLIEAKGCGHALDESKMEERAGTYRSKVLGVVVSITVLMKVSSLSLKSPFCSGTTGCCRASVSVCWIRT